MLLSGQQKVMHRVGRPHAARPSTTYRKNVYRWKQVSVSDLVIRPLANPRFLGVVNERLLSCLATEYGSMGMPLASKTLEDFCHEASTAASRKTHQNSSLDLQVQRLKHAPVLQHECT